MLASGDCETVGFLSETEAVKLLRHPHISSLAELVIRRCGDYLF